MAKTFTAESISKDILATGFCNIPEVGKFKVKERPARQGRHPVDGSPITIAAKKVLTFSPSSVITKKLNG